MPYSESLPPTRATGDPDPAADVNALARAILELRSSTAIEDLSNVTPIGELVSKAVTQADARAAIGAGTSSVQPASLIGAVVWNGTAWPTARPTGYALIIFFGGTTRPSIMNGTTDLWIADA